MRSIVKSGLDSGISNERKLFLKWCIGLTEKGIQNVLRGKGDEFENYLDVLDKSIRDAAKQCSMEYGDLEGVLRIRGVESRVNWRRLPIRGCGVGKTRPVGGAVRPA